MKRVLNVILVLSLLTAMAVPALARNVGFVPSISDKGAPSVIGSGEILNISGVSVGVAVNNLFVITPVSQATTSESISKEDGKVLVEAYEELTSTKDIYTICPEMEEVANESYGEVKAEELVVRDLFDISLSDAEVEKQVANGNTITVKLNAKVAKDEKVLAMVKSEGKWVPAVKVVNNGDGTISVTLPALGAVVLMTTQAPASSATGDATNIAFWGAAVVLSLGAIVTMVVLKRRKVAE